MGTYACRLFLSELYVCFISPFKLNLAKVNVYMGKCIFSFLQNAFSNALLLIVTDSFTLRTQSVSWREAGKRCALDGAHLAVYSDSASPTLTKLVKNIHGRVWIDNYSKGKFFIAMFA